jgi:hypothetical protein
MSWHWNPLARFGVFASPVVVASAAGAIAATQGFSDAQAAGTAGAAALVGVTALAGGVAAARKGIIRKPTRLEIALARQIREGLGRLRDILTQSVTGQRLPATPTLLVQADEEVEKWVTQLDNLQQKAATFADKRLAETLSEFVTIIQNQRAFMRRPQRELLSVLSGEKAPESLKILLMALLGPGLGLTEEDRNFLLTTEGASGLTLEEAVRLLLVSRERKTGTLPVRPPGELLEAVRKYSEAANLPDILKYPDFIRQSNAEEPFRKLMDEGGFLAQQIFNSDELEKSLAAAFWACDQIIGEDEK